MAPMKAMKAAPMKAMKAMKGSGKVLTKSGLAEALSAETEEVFPLVSETLSMQRDMLKKMRLGKPFEEITAEDVAVLKEVVHRHGAACVVGANLDPAGLRSLAEQWGEVLVLPPGLAFNAQVPGLPEVARVGNVQLDGSVKPKHTAAEYWHHDGDFWPVGKNKIFNFLSAAIVPETGGNTGFLDTRKAFQALEAEQREKLRDAFVVVHAGDISDFNDSAEDERPQDVAHDVVQRRPTTGEEMLYLPASDTGIQAASGERIGDTTDYIEKVMNDPDHGPVEFAWTVGDLLIWDNRSTMHRSMGGYADEARLLYRIQARIP